jgi:uncharacterized surface protein with fasciclin (FAS1) repeats
MEQSKNTSAQQPRSSTPYKPPAHDIVDTAIAAGHFTTLVTAVKAAGLVETLKGKGPFTVFAPSDEAFAKLPSGALDALLKDTAKLKAVLSYHVVAGHVMAKGVKTGAVMTLQGSPLTALVSATGVHVNGAHVKGADVTATNGVIHAIDAVIMPKHWQLVAAA